MEIAIYEAEMASYLEHLQGGHKRLHIWIHDDLEISLESASESLSEIEKATFRALWSEKGIDRLFTQKHEFVLVSQR